MRSAIVRNILRSETASKHCISKVEISQIQRAHSIPSPPLIIPKYIKSYDGTWDIPQQGNVPLMPRNAVKCHFLLYQVMLRNFKTKAVGLVSSNRNVLTQTFSVKLKLKTSCQVVFNRTVLKGERGLN